MLKASSAAGLLPRIKTGLLCLLLTACQHIQPEVDDGKWLNDDHFSNDQMLNDQQHELLTLNHWRVSSKIGIAVTQSNPQLGSPLDKNTREQANMVWTFSDQSHQVRLFGPLGAGQIKIDFDQYGVQLSDNHGVIHRGNSAEQLLTDIVGWPIPVDALTHWLFALPMPDQPFQYQQNQQGHVTAIRQLGWLIDFSDYRGYSSKETQIDRHLPRKLIATKLFAPNITSTKQLQADSSASITIKMITKGWQW